MCLTDLHPSDKTPVTAKILLGVVFIGVVLTAIICTTAFCLRSKILKTNNMPISDFANPKSSESLNPQEMNHLITDRDGARRKDNDDSGDVLSTLEVRHELAASFLPASKYRHLSNRSQCSSSFSCTTDGTCIEGEFCNLLSSKDP